MIDRGPSISLASRMQSLLFVPGSRPDRFAGALASGSDAVCIDLEDAVPADGKAAARSAVLAALGDPRLTVRINNVLTADGRADLEAFAGSSPALLLLPKVESAAEVDAARAALPGAGIVPLIETPRGLRLAHGIAAAPGVAAMMFGGGDLSAELGVALAWEPLLVARGLFILACAEAKVPAIDVPFIVLDDETGLAEETRRAKAMGFAAKAAIHPKQIAAIHRIMRPTSVELDEAREAAAVYADADGGATRFRGRMLEAPIMARYRRILELGESVDA